MYAIRSYYDADLEVINRAMAQRLRGASEEDAAVNAVVILDVLAKTLPFAILDELADMRQLFSSYLECVITSYSIHYTKLYE